MGLVETPFKLTSEEILCSAAITVLLNALSKEEISINTVEQMCFTPQYGFTASASSIPCGPHLVRITDIKEGNIDWSTVPYCECEDAENYQLYNNDILIARAGASIGKTFIAKNISTEAIFASYMIRLRVKSNFNPKFVYWCLQSQQFWVQTVAAQRGSAMKNINAKMISALAFPVPSLDIQSAIVAFLDAFQINLKDSKKTLPTLPHPLEEQRRIVARIEELAAKIEEARELRRVVVEEVDVLMTSAMNKFWDDQNSWKQSYVRDLAVMVSGLVDPQIEPYNNLPHINGEAMESGTGRLLPYRMAKDDSLISGKFHFKAGSILYSKIRPYLRKAVQVPVEGICSADVYAFESISAELDPRFFMYSLISPIFTAYANEISGRTRMPKLNQEQLFSFKMSYPDISQQRQIVSYLDRLQLSMGQLRKKQSETSAELNALLPSILDKAFKGEL